MAGDASPDVAPCEDYVMTTAFRDWMVAELRNEVLGQLALSGLDRMAIVKAGQAGTATPSHSVDRKK
jgi:hypothetical protein